MIRTLIFSFSSVLFSRHEMSLPVIYTPITVLQAPWDGAYRGQCGHYKMDFMRCASRVGLSRAQYDCKKELDDFRECFWTQKQVCIGLHDIYWNKIHKSFLTDNLL